MNPTPLVSIVCSAFNQEKYIAEAIEGFLKQKTDFTIEVIIHDDASKDRTAEIIKSFAAQNPDVIFPILQTENQYSRGKSPLYSFVLPKVRGKYIAFCEGDDFWTDPYKLRKQVDYLERHPEYGLVHTDNSNLNQNSGKILKSHKYDYYPNPPSGNVFEPLLLKNFVSTLTVVVNTDLLRTARNDINVWLAPGLILDYSVWLEVSRRTKIKYLDEITAAYRITPGSMSHQISQQKRDRWNQQVYDLKIAFIERYSVNQSIENKIVQKRLSQVLTESINNGQAGNESFEPIKSIQPKTIENKILSRISRKRHARLWYRILFAPAILKRMLLKRLKDSKNSVSIGNHNSMSLS